MHQNRANRFVSAAAAVAAGTVIIAVAPGVASATPTSYPTTGQTRITIANSILKQFENSDCGLVTIAGVGGGATATYNSNGSVAIKVPVTAVVTDADSNGDGAVTIQNSGNVYLSNACYDIGLVNFRIKDDSQSEQSEEFDLNANVKDGSGRQVIGELDFSNIVVTYGNHNNVHVEQLKLILADEGANILNDLYSADGSGPFYAGLQAGSANTKFKVPQGS